MYKLIMLLTCVFMVGVLPATAGTNELGTQITKQIVKSKPSNKGASEENFRVDFTISEKFFDENMNQDNGPFKANIACKAYALDAHWLLLAGTCMDYSKEDIRMLGDHVYMERHSRKVHRAVVSGKSLAPNQFARNNQVMLIWTDNLIFQGPYINVLATEDITHLAVLSLKNTLKIHTARFGVDKLRERHLKTPLEEYGNTFKLKEGITDLSGTATDPLFIYSHTNGNEFLAAYNKGMLGYALQMTIDDSINTYTGHKSDTWYSLTKADLEFIKQTVQQHRPEDWFRIKNRLFFNQMNTPFFK